MAYDLYPAVDEVYSFPPEVRHALAVSMELRNTVVPMDTVTRNNLLPAELWEGRVIANTTTDHLERFDAQAVAWFQIANLSEVVSKTQGDTDYVNVSGDSMTGNLEIKKSVPLLNLDDTATQSGGGIYFKRNGLMRWLIRGQTAETSADFGSDFFIQSRHDDGTANDTVLTFKRSTGLGTVLGNPTDALGIVPKQYVDLLGLAGLKIRKGTNVVTASGIYATVPFGTTFGAVPVVVACPGDAVNIDGAQPFYVGTVRTNNFDCGNFVANGQVRINWIAIGTI